MTVKNLTSKEFEEFINKGVALVDFYADWCAPCKIISPIVDQLSREIKAVKFGKTDVDKEGNIAQQYYVMSIPTLIIFKDGEQFDRIVGAAPKEELIEKIEKALEKN